MSLMDYRLRCRALHNFGYVSQVLKVCRTRAMHDIALKTFSVPVTGISLWLAYGFWSGDIPLMAANSITLVLASTSLYFRIKHG